MTREEFLEATRNAHISAAAFSLKDEGDECYALANTSGGWEVFYSERGSKTNPRYFMSESDALIYLLSLLTSDTQTRNGGE